MKISKLLAGCTLAIPSLSVAHAAQPWTLSGEESGEACSGPFFTWIAAIAAQLAMLLA